jgi:hypothetical protein
MGNMRKQLPDLTLRDPSIVGLPFPSSLLPSTGVIRDLPDEVANAVQALNAQIAAQFVDPLLSASSVEELAGLLQKSFTRFWGTQLSLTGIVMTWLGRDAQRLSNFTWLAFQEAEAIVRERGYRWIGVDGTAVTLAGLSTMKRISLRAASEWFALEVASERSVFQKRDLTNELSEGAVRQWQHFIVAYTMVTWGVLRSLEVVPPRGRQENAVALAFWGRGFAVEAFHLAKEVGLLVPPVTERPVVLGDANEEERLAAAGLDHYASGLAREEKE